MLNPRPPCPSLIKQKIGFHLLFSPRVKVFGGRSRLNLILLYQRGRRRASFRPSLALNWALEEESAADLLEISDSHPNSVAVDKAGKDLLDFSDYDNENISAPAEELSGSHPNSAAMSEVGEDLRMFSDADDDDDTNISSSADDTEEISVSRQNSVAMDNLGKDFLVFSDADDNNDDDADEVNISSSEDCVNGNLRIFSGEKKAGRLNVKALAQSLWECSTADDVDHVLGKLEDIHPSVYSSMIKGLGMDKKVDPALALVEWLKRKREGNKTSLPNVIIYNSLLCAVRLSGDFAKAEGIIKDMEELGVPPNVISYNTMMHIYIDQGKYAEALQLPEIMKDKGISPSAATFSTALLAYQTSGDASGAIAFFSELKDMFEQGNIGGGRNEDWELEFVKLKNFTVRICFQVMRQWLINEEINPTSSIFKLLADMDTAGVSGGRVELEKISWACTRESHHVVGRELYRRIRNLESGASLSVCNHIIWLMGKAKKWWAALEIYEDLLDQGPKPNNLSYELIASHFNILLSAARKRGLWRWGLRLLNKMQDRGLKPGTKEWNAVLIACSKASETTSAIQIFKMMVECGEKPTIVSYGALLSALEKGELYDEALRVWDHMCKMGIKPNLHAYTILASIYVGRGQPELVESTIRDMSSSGVYPTVVTFNAIITGCARKNQGSAAYEWFHRMKIRNITPNEITYEMLIETLARDGKPRLAFEIYARAYNEGLQLSVKAYDAVIRSCQLYGAGIDVDMLGPRPPRTKNCGNSGKSLTTHVSRRGQPFVREACVL
ncbi:uncharacterized protein LOC144710134 [Wolffia australiana]